MSKRVLVVEDDDGAWGIIAMCLEREPYRIQRERNGTKALDALRAGGFDAVLLDLMIEGMSGHEVLKELDKDPKFKGFPILINSAVGETRWTRDQVVACKNLRIESTPRPFDPLELIETMRGMLGLPTDEAEIIKEKVNNPAPAGNPKATGPKRKVLIVDDDSGVRAMYVPYFTGKGYDALAASNGREALDILQREKVALIILDLNMPEMSGEEVLKAIFGNPAWKKIPIIIDTAVDPASGRLDKVRAAFEGKLRIGFFQRPTSLDELNERIEQILVS